MKSILHVHVAHNNWHLHKWVTSHSDVPYSRLFSTGFYFRPSRSCRKLNPRKFELTEKMLLSVATWARSSSTSSVCQRLENVCYPIHEVASLSLSMPPRAVEAANRARRQNVSDLQPFYVVTNFSWDFIFG